MEVPNLGCASPKMGPNPIEAVAPLSMTYVSTDSAILKKECTSLCTHFLLHCLLKLMFSPYRSRIQGARTVPDGQPKMTQ